MSNPSYNPYAPGNPNSTQGQREHNMQTSPGLCDYDLRASDKPAAAPEHRKPRFTSETAAKILLHFGLEKEDLEFLISYPEDQMTPANLPLILHQIRLQKDRDNSGGSGYVSTMDTADNRNCREPLQKKDTEQESSFTSLGSSCSSALSSASPSSDKTTQSQMLPKQTFQDTLSSFPLQKVNTDMRFYKSEAPKPVPLNQQEVDCQSTLKTQLPSSLSHGIHPSQPGLVLIGSNDWTFQDTLSSFPRPKKDTDIKVYKFEAPKPVPLNQQEVDCQSTLKTQLPSTLSHGLHPSQPGLVLSGSNDASDLKEASKSKVSKKKGKGSVVKYIMGQKGKQTEQMQHHSMQLIQKQPVEQAQKPPMQQQQATKETVLPQKLAVSEPGRAWMPGDFEKAVPVTGVIPGQMNVPTFKGELKDEVAVSKDQPSPEMLYDYAVAIPKIFPHTCSLCNKDCTDLKDWLSHNFSIQHQKNSKVLRKQFPKLYSGGIAKPSTSTSAKNTRHGSRSSSKSIIPHRQSSRSQSPQCSGYGHRYSPSSPTQSTERCSRSRSPKRRSRSRSPKRRSRSPKRRSRSPSPERRSRSRSPERRSRSRSPERRSRSRSPKRRSRSPSPKRRSRSPSPERWSSTRRKDDRLSPPRKFHDRRSPLRRSKETRLPTRRAYDRRSPTWWTSKTRSPKRRSNERQSSPGRVANRKSSPRKVSKKYSPPWRSDDRCSPLRRVDKRRSPTAVQSLSDPIDLESVVKSLAPALLAELAKMTSSTSPPASRQVRLKDIQQSFSHSDVAAAVDYFGKTESVTLYRSRKEAIVVFEREEDAEKLRSSRTICVRGQTIVLRCVKEKLRDSFRPPSRTPATHHTTYSTKTTTTTGVRPPKPNIPPQRGLRFRRKATGKLIDGKKNVSAEVVRTVNRARVLVSKAKIMLIKRISGAKKERKQAKQGTSLESKTTSPETQSVTGDSKHKPVPERSTISIGGSGVGLKGTDANGRVREAAKGPSLDEKVQASQAQKPKTQEDELAESAAETAGKDESAPSRCVHSESQPHGESLKQSDTECQESPEVRKNTAKSVKVSPPTVVKLQGVDKSLSHCEVLSAAENFGKTKSVVLFRARSEAIVIFEKEEGAQKLKMAESLDVSGRTIPVVVEKETVSKEKTVRQLPKGATTVTEGKVFVSDATHVSAQQRVKTGALSAEEEVKTEAGKQKTPLRSKSGSTENHPDAGDSSQKPVPKKTKTTVREPVVGLRDEPKAPEPATCSVIKTKIKAGSVSTTQKPKSPVDEPSAQEAENIRATAAKDGSKPTKSTDDQSDVENRKPKESEAKVQERLEDPKDTAEVVGKENVAVSTTQKPKTPSEAVTNERMAAPEKSADNPRESQPRTGSVQNQPTETSDKASSQVQERPPSEPAFTARGPETRTEVSQEEQQTGGRKNNAGVEEAAGKDGSVPSRSANPQSQPHGVKLEQNEIKIQEFLEVPKDTGTKVEKTVKAHDAEEPVELGVSGAKVVDGKGGETSPEAVPVNSRPQPVETQRTEPSVKASTQVQQSPLSVPETGIEASLKHQQAAGSTKETAVVAAMRGGGAAVKKKRHEDDDASKVVVKVASPVKTEPTAAAEPSRAPRVTVGEMLHEQLYPELIRSVRPYFLTHSRLLPHSHKNLLIFGLPHYYEGFYTEKNVANLLFPFGLRSVDSLYVIPQSGMAFVVMPKIVNVLHFMRECALNGIYLRGTRLHAAVIDFRGNFKILQFYTFLKRLLRCCLFNEKNRTVFISNISPSATRELREALREFGPVTNFMPLLNKVFVEFEFVKDAERFGLWHSQLKRPLGYTWLVIRLNGQIISSPSLGPVPAVATQSGAASAKDASKTAAAGEVSAVMKDKVPTVQKPGISEGTRPAAASVTKGRVAGDATAVPSKSEAPEKQPGAGVPKAKAIPDISATGVKGPGLVGRIEKSKISTKTELGKGPLLEAKVLASKEGMVTTIQKENQAEAGAALHERIAKDGTVPSKDKPSINQTGAGDSKSKPVTDKSDTRVKESGLVETSVVDKLENRTITELGKGPLVGEGVLAFKKEIVSSKQKPETLSGNLAVTEAVSNERIAQDVTEVLENQTDAGVPKLNPEPGKSVTNDKEPKVGLKETAKVGQVFAPKKEPLSTKQESKTQVDKLAESRVETNRNIKEAALSVPSRSAETQNPRESFKVKLNELKIHKSLEVSKDTAKVIEKEKVTIFEHEGQGKIDKAHNAEQPMELGVSGAKAGEGRGGETSPEAVPVKSTDKPKDSQPQAVETQPTETSVKASTQVRESTLSEPESTARGPQTRTKASQMKRQAAGSTKEAAVEAVIPGGGAETKTTQHGPATMLTTQTDAAAATSHGDSGLVQRDASTLKQMPEEGSGPIAGKSDDKPAVPDGAGKKRETNNEDHSKELNTRSKDTYQVNDSVEDQPKTTESETENKQEKKGEAMARRDSRPSGRSNPTSKASIHEEERSPRKQDRTNERHETRQKMDTTADKKLLQSSRESSCRKISTTGNKEEIPTRSTRGKTARKTEDASTEKTKGKDAPTRRSLNKHTVSQEGQSEDGRRRHRKQIQTVDNAGCDKEEKSNEEPTGTTLRSEKRKLDNDTNEVKDETSTPRTRGQPKKITRLTPVSKSTRRKDATSGKEKEEKKASSSSSLDKDSSKLSTDGTLNVQRTAGMKTASKAESGSASVGLENKKLEGCLKEGEKEERSCADLKVVSKKRRDAVGPEAKRSRSQSPSVPADFKLPEFKTNNPLGNEFVVPAYFCNLCSVFYQHESTAEGPHCNSQTHLNNLQKHYEEVQQKSAGSSTKS